MSSSGLKSSMKYSNVTLASAQKDIDKLKLEVDDILKNDIPGLEATSPDRKKIFSKVSRLKESITNATKRVESIQLATEGIPTATFNKRKDQEFKRLNQLKDQIEKIYYQLEPDETEEEYFRLTEKWNASRKQVKILNEPKSSANQSTSVQNEPESATTKAKSNRVMENEDEDETDDDDYGVYEVQALADFKGEEDGDLAFAKGEKMTITETREDGWWMAENLNGKSGLVPSTLLKILDFEPEEVAASEDIGGMTDGSLEGKRSGKEIWSSLRKSKNEVSVTDVLKAMKAVPTGFRNSTLGLLLKSDEYRPSNWIVPKLSESNVSFKDLFWDHVNKRLRPRPVKLTRSFSLIVARMIPLPGQGLETKSRHARIALWDGREILSNVHTVRAIPVEKDNMTWSFTPKVTRLLPSLYDGDGIVRIDSAMSSLAILFELNYSYIRSSSGDKGETSIGWVSLPLFEHDGSPVANKNYELNLNGGTPFERGVEVDPTINLQGGKSLFQSLVKVNRQPRITVKLTTVNRLSRARIDLLPDTIVTCQSYIKFIGYYRELLAKKLASSDQMKSVLIFDPILSGFPKAIDFPDLMDALKMTWDDKLKLSVRRSQRRNPSFLITLFNQCYLESIFAVQQCALLPPYTWANEHIEQERFRFILSFLERKNALESLLSPDFVFKPMFAENHAFDTLSKSSLMVQPVGQSEIGNTGPLL